MSDSKWKRVFAPPSEVDPRDTGLRFTDILFGFVIFQLFLRLQQANEFPGFARWQLVVGAVLVLGSWIGFRRSLSRSDYQPKFVNLPLIRFVLDQAMVILYFRVAVLYPNDPDASINPSSLAHQTCVALVAIYFLYLVWDIFGIWMAKVGDENGTWKYPEIDRETNEKRDRPAPVNLVGTAITSGFFLGFVVLYLVTRWVTVGARGAAVIFAIAALLLFLYRWAKEIRTSLLRPGTKPHGPR
jgi:hypothetical protein